MSPWLWILVGSVWAAAGLGLLLTLFALCGPYPCQYRPDDQERQQHRARYGGRR